MEDEVTLNLDGKNLANLRVVDLKQELEKRGLSKSGSKKELVKRLKQQVEFEKLCGERKSSGDCDLTLELDADTEQNEFVQQYLAQQQKIYAEQKEVKRRIELEGKSNYEKESCDSTKEEGQDTEEDSEEEEVKGLVSDKDTDSKNDPSPISPSVNQDVHSTVSPKNVEEVTGPKTPEVEENTKDSPLDFSKTAEISEDSPVTNMEVSSVPFSLSDIQLPESPGKIKLSSMSDHGPSDGLKPASELQSNGVDSTSTEDVSLLKKLEGRLSTEDDSNGELCKNVIGHEDAKESAKVDNSTSLHKDTKPVIKSCSSSDSEGKNLKTKHREKDKGVSSEREPPIKAEKFVTKTIGRSRSSSVSDKEYEQSRKSRHKSKDSSVNKGLDKTDRQVRSKDIEKHAESKDKKHKTRRSINRSESSGSNGSERKFIRRDISSAERVKIKKHADTKHRKHKVRHSSSSSSRCKSDSDERAQTNEKKKKDKRKMSSGHTSSSSSGKEMHKKKERKSEGRRSSESDHDSRKIHVGYKSDMRHQERPKKDTKYSSIESDSKRVEVGGRRDYKKIGKELEKCSRSKSREQSLDKSPVRRSEKIRRRSVSWERRPVKSHVRKFPNMDLKLHKRDNSTSSSGTDEGVPSLKLCLEQKRELLDRSSGAITKSKERSNSREKSPQNITVLKLGGKQEIKQKSNSQERDSEKRGRSSSQDRVSTKSLVLKSEERRQRSSSRDRSSHKSPVLRSEEIRQRSRSQDRGSCKSSVLKSEKNQKSSSQERRFKESPIKMLQRRSSSYERSGEKSLELTKRPPNNRERSLEKSLIKLTEISSSGERNPERSPVNLMEKKLTCSNERSKDKSTDGKSSSSHEKHENSSKSTERRKSSSSHERSLGKLLVKSTEGRQISSSGEKTLARSPVSLMERRQTSSSCERSPGRSPVKLKQRRHSSSSCEKSPEKSSIVKSQDFHTSLKKTERAPVEHSDGELSSSLGSDFVKSSEQKKVSEIKVISEGELSSESSEDEKPVLRKLSIESSLSNSKKDATITVVRKEIPKQRMKIKRDNVILSRSAVVSKDESKSSVKANNDHLTALSKSSEEIKEDHLKVELPAMQKYVSRKINISGRKKSEDEPKSKKSKWESFATSQRASLNINISSDSLKSWFPDFKLLKAQESTTDLVNECIPHEDVKIDIPEVKTEEILPSASVEKLKDVEHVEEPLKADTSAITKILYVQNLVRPFTLNQLKTLLNETGKIKEDSFWIDKIKSKCFVTYQSEEEAAKTQQALNGTRWPSSNPKILLVEFSTEEEMKMVKSGHEVARPVPQLPAETHEVRRPVHPSEDPRKKVPSLDHMVDRSRNRQPLREWDQDKITQDSPVRDFANKERRLSDKKERKDTKKRVADDTPAKLLDDLFQKTKSTPCIYWLPLTDERIRERAESRRLQRIEREKRNQAKEQEEEEQRNKREKSPHRPREKETKRSPTRSRSPLNRRR